MPIFVVQARGSDPAALERARFIPQRFSWPAFLFTPVWLAYHRLWLALVAWVAFAAAFVLLLAPSLTVVASTAFSILAKLLVGFEGAHLRTAKGARAAVVSDVVEARDRDEAEARFYHSWFELPDGEAPQSSGAPA